MKYTSVDQYANHIHESIALAILKRIFGQKIKPALNQATDILMNDEEFDQDLQNMKDSLDNIEANLDRICKLNPKHPLCKDRGKPVFQWRS